MTSRADALALAFVFAFALVGCLRLGGGDDLHLVCEEKSASPRKAYDVGFLVAQTTVEGELEDMDRVAILEAARHHVITMGGRPHAGFSARLADVGDQWRFLGAGEREGRAPDLYNVTMARDPWMAPPIVTPPTSVMEPAVRAANASEAARAALGNVPAGVATWDPGLPSCVSLAAGAGRVVVNVVQERVVLVESG